MKYMKQEKRKKEDRKIMSNLLYIIIYFKIRIVYSFSIRIIFVLIRRESILYVTQPIKINKYVTNHVRPSINLT